jgi:hypothetical protein
MYEGWSSSLCLLRLVTSSLLDPFPQHFMLQRLRSSRTVTHYDLPHETTPWSVKQSCPCSRHEGIWWSGGIAPLILGLGTRLGKWFNSHLGSPTYSRGKCPQYTFSSRLGEPWNWSRRYEGDINLLQGIDPRILGCPTGSLVIVLTGLSWLSLKL